MLVCLKLEAILTMLLVEFCCLKGKDIGQRLIGYYLKNYSDKEGSYNGAVANTLEGEYLSVLKDYCKMNLGDLIFEVFDSHSYRGKEYPKFKSNVCAAQQFKLNSEKGNFDRINTIRSKVAHYGKQTDERILGLLNPYEDQVMTWYLDIVNKVFKAFKKPQLPVSINVSLIPA